MNKIIWKGIDSTTIKGLVISELPPITKPKMRVQETEIDGVDGSIIEELGYETYDKSLKIGLARDFDIDEVIKYFSGAGKVVFSNEPDKYYNARIIEQVDYERLLRFREATIRFRVQPFKYEHQEEASLLIQELVGTEVEIISGKTLNISIDGRSTQNGVPTPETPVEIESVGAYNEGTSKYEIDVNITNETETSTIEVILDEPLRSLPDGTKDIVYIENDILKVERKVKSIILNGTEKWGITNVGETSALFYLDMTKKPRPGCSCMSNRFIHVANNYTATDPIGIKMSSNYRLFVRAPLLTVADFKSWLSLNNTEVIYESEYPSVMETMDKTGKYTMPEGNVVISNSVDANMVVSYVDDKVIAINKGNYKAKPVITIKGTGYIEFILNGNKLFSYMFPTGESEVVIDSQKQDAYLGTILKNRSMSGEFPIFEIGENIITWEGDIESIEITSKSRWL